MQSKQLFANLAVFLGGRWRNLLEDESVDLYKEKAGPSDSDPSGSDPTAANCYIISAAGMHQFKAVYGNSTTRIKDIASVEVLWESFGTSQTPSKGDIIQFVSYIPGNASSPGIISFSTPSILKNGNAVIAAMDANNKVLWSWHIWVCKDYDPAATAETYNNNAGKMMDRNLGATSDTPGNVGALGLLYQWGRKDPFLSGDGISSSTKAKSTIIWPSPVGSSSNYGTVAYAVENPTTFIMGASGTSYDWVYSSRDDTLWQSAKTIYDPCPPGWRIPDGGEDGVWAKALGSSNPPTWNSTNKGMNFHAKFGGLESIWYPAAGYVVYDSGRLEDVGCSGLWWSCSPHYSIAYSLSLYDHGAVYPTSTNNRASGFSVRCLQE